MKIAIQGHLTRGKEIIQILESLGGKKLYHSNADDKCLVFFIDNKGYISCLHYENPILKENYKIYTLKEFEKEFPFKIGDKVIFKTDYSSNPTVYTITGFEFYRDEFCYSLDDLHLHFSPTRLKLYQPMKERNVTLTFEKAREWYNKGGSSKK